MAGKYAILLDGGFVIAKLKQRLGNDPSADDIVKECERIKNLQCLSEKELVRIYFYHAPPASFKIENPIDKSVINLSQTPQYKKSKQLLDQLELKPDFALRLGEIKQGSWKLGRTSIKSLSKNPRSIKATDLVPDLKQKGVDLRIGLDIARLSLCHLVDIIVVITGDSDMVPAFKFARREGLRIYLDHLGHGVYRELKAHTDLLI